MDELKKKYKLNIKISILVYLGLFLVSSFCFFIDQIWIPLGFLLGGILSIINFIILYEFSYYIAKPMANARSLSVFLFTCRMAIYVLGFLICIVPMKFGFRIFFWGTCLASYLLEKIINYFCFKSNK